MYKAIHHDGRRSLVDPLRYLQRHDVVYQRPSLKPYEGLPLGDGKLGGLLYHTGRGFTMQVNHTDAIDFAPDGEMQAWAWEAEERNTAPVACGSVSIQSALPCFDWVYMKEYEERLSLADGCVYGKAVTPFSRVEWKAYAANGQGALVFHVDAWQQEDAAWDIVLERWPSPNFFHHYEQVVPLYDKNLSIVSACVENNDVILRQDLGRVQAAMVCQLCAKEFSVELLHSRGGVFRLPKQREHHFTLFVSAAAECSAQQAALTCAEALRACGNETELFRGHCAAWKEFWSRSFVHLEQEDYLENLWYLYMYQLNSCGRGRYPFTFAGLWGWFKDSRNWGHFYHWNHQQNYWPVLSGGHPELYENYLSYRWSMLDHAKKDAANIFGAAGAFFSDISNLNGYNALEPDTVRNCSVGAQIALDFYRYFLYTGDKAFLTERAMPMMLACADFYQSLARPGEDGTMRLPDGATAYESYWPLKTTLTDLYVLKALLGAIRETGSDAGVGPAKLETYSALEQHLYSALTELIEHEGHTLEIFSVGEKWDGEPVHYGEGEYPWSPFPASLISPVWPAGCITLADEGTQEFNIMCNTARVLLDRDVYRLGKIGCSGHAPAPEMAARLGMSEDMPRILRHFVQAYQIFPNGMMHFADVSQNQQWSAIDRPRILLENADATQWEELHEKRLGDRTEIPSEWFLHCYFEAAANLTAGINEMLLQSCGGVLRVFPALPKEQDAMFTLWGEGGFAVTSESCRGEIRYVAIRSTRGGVCRLVDPWPGEQLAVRQGHERVDILREKGHITFDTTPGREYILFRREYPPECFYHATFSAVRNEGVKRLGKMQIGLAKYY